MELINDLINSIDIDMLTETAKKGGPVMGIFLPVIEAFFPALPLVLFVTINVEVFGFLQGYIYSWIGNCLGAYLLFLLVRKIGGKKIEAKINSSKYASSLQKIKSKNFTLLFFLYCFPFTPSFLISGASALANMNSREFLSALMPSKLIMLISLSFIGVNIGSFFENPVRSAIFLILILIFNFLCKWIFDKYEKKQDKKTD